MIKCKIFNKNNNAYYEVSDGAVFVENYNETLDSGVIILQQLTSEIDIEPYDLVEIKSESSLTIETRYFCVDTYIKTQISLNPPIYKYEIDLFSPTKLLEGMVCPNLTITKVNGITRTVGDYITQYMTLYCVKTNSDRIYGGAIDNLISVSGDLYNYFDMECPEMQWNEPTLREVLNDLMMVNDCIPVVKVSLSGVLYLWYINISEVGNAVEDNPAQLNGINYIQDTQSSDDYVSDLKMHLVNTANNTFGNSYNNPTDATKVVERIGFRNNESYLLTTNDILLQTTYPIWKIYSLKVYAVINTKVYYLIAGGTQLYTTHKFEVSLDLTPYVLEHADWLTRDVYYGQWGSSSTLSSQYRNTSLYYNRGGNNIYNFNDKQTVSELFIENSIFVVQLITTALRNEINATNQQIINWFNNESGISGTFDGATPNEDDTPSYTDLQFELSYDALDEFVFTASKMPFTTHRRTVIDNQTNSYINIDRQGILEYLKAKRLGNKLSLVNARYETNESNIPALSDTINNKIIFRKEMSVYNNVLDVNYLTTENYVLKDYFTGVKSKLRSWRVVSGAEATTRADLIKLYINYGEMANFQSANWLVPVYNNISAYLLNFQYCAIDFVDKNGNYLPANKTYYDKATNQNIDIGVNAIQVEFTKHRAGNSVVFTVKMLDNFYDGNYVSAYNGSITDKTEQKGVKYADDDGEIVSGHLYFYSNCNEIDFINQPDDFLASKGLKPLVNIGKDTSAYSGLNLNSQYLVCKIPFIVYKDNKEILQISVQFEFNDEANDMFIGYNKNQ